MSTGSKSRFNHYIMHVLFYLTILGEHNHHRQHAQASLYFSHLLTLLHDPEPLYFAFAKLTLAPLS